MIRLAECADLQPWLHAYLDGTLDSGERGAFESHLNACEVCRARVKRFAALNGLLAGTLGGKEHAAEHAAETSKRLRGITTGGTPALVPDAFDPEPFGAPAGFLDRLGQRMGAAPWWLVSGAFHALLLMLVALLGAVIMKANDRDTVILTSLEKKPPEKEEEKERVREIFKTDTPIVTEQVNPTPAVVMHEEVEVAEHHETDERMDAREAFGDEGISDIPLGGSGFSGAIGVGGGGAGAFGRPQGGGRQRMARALQAGGSKETENAVDLGLDWLARHQEPDGSWSHSKHGATNQYHVGMRGDAAMTGFALLAFLGAGHTERVGKYKETVRKATQWLLEHQGEKHKDNVKGWHEGRWADLNYTQGIATMAISEAAAMGRNPAVRKAAQKAVDGVDFAQNRADGASERWAWDYFHQGGTNDASIMAWNVLALKSGKVAGLSVDPAAFEGAIRWIDHAQILDDQKGKEHLEDYDWLGGLMPYRGQPNRVPGTGSWATMAAAALCRLTFGGAELDHPGVLGPCNKILKSNLPKGYPYNLYYGYYATLLMFQKGGEHWQGWNDAMKPALLNGQRRGGPKDGSPQDVDGSWDHGEASHCESRVMSTALAVLCLEVYYRYLPLYR